MSTINEEILDADEAVQQAYDRSEITGKKWTISRHSASLLLSVKIMAKIGEVGPEAVAFMAKAGYEDSFRDVVLALWLCHLTDEEVMELNVTRDIRGAVQAAFTWAEEEKLSWGSKAYMDGIELLTQIFLDIQNSFFTLESKSEGPVKKSPVKSTPRRGKSERATSPA